LPVQVPTAGPFAAVKRRGSDGWCPVASFTMKHALLCSSTIQGGGKRRAEGMGMIVREAVGENDETRQSASEVPFDIVASPKCYFSVTG
jgi:hypothetical protein